MTAKEWAADIHRALGNGLRYDPILTTGKSLLETKIEEVIADAIKYWPSTPSRDIDE